MTARTTTTTSANVTPSTAVVCLLGSLAHRGSIRTRVRRGWYPAGLRRERVSVASLSLPAMRLSHLFFATLRDDPTEAEMPSHRLLLRAGYVRQLGSGIYSLLPLGKRATKRVEQVIREEIDAI